MRSASGPAAPRGVSPFLRSLRDSLRGDLRWTRTGAFRREFHLTAGSETLARIAREGFLGLRATAEAADGAWSFERQGFWRRVTIVREGESAAREGETEVARYQHGFLWRGSLRFASGSEFEWRRSGLARPLHFWSAGEDTVLIGYRRQLWPPGSFEMEVAPQALRLAELPVLVLAGAFLMILASAHKSAAH